jgi:SIR2-like domain
MDHLASWTGGDWIEIAGDSSSGAASGINTVGSRETFQNFVREVLLSENLVVLCGLGTSREVFASGKPILPTMADLWAEAEVHQDFASVISGIRFDETQKPSNIEFLLSRCHGYLSLGLGVTGADLGKFVTDLEQMIVRRCQLPLTGISLAAHEAFLRKVARRPTHRPRMKLFTTNYDLGFEAAAARNGFVVVDGFSYSQPPMFDPSNFSYDIVRRKGDSGNPEFIPNVFHLNKLHGSVDWVRRGNEVVRDSKTTEPVLIYPRSNKFELSYGQPFLEIMARFQAALRQPNTGLLVIGCGFSDDHVSQPLLAAVRSNVGMKAVVVGLNLKAETRSKEPLAQIAALINAGDQRLMLIDARFGDFASALPELVAATDEEAHSQRVLKVRSPW